MECKEIDRIIKQKDKEKIFSHIVQCKDCYERYVKGDCCQLLSLLNEVDRDELYWARQRNSILSQVRGVEYVRRIGWLKYAAAILVIFAIILMIEVPRDRMEISPEKAITRQMKEEVEVRPIIEEINNPDARLYKIELDEKTHLIMIVDSNINL